MGNEVAGVAQADLADLRDWYERYSAADILGFWSQDIHRALDQDVINSEDFEQQIVRHASVLPDFEYFCGECRETLDHWPASDEESLIRLTNTIALEAAARRGCRFCSFLLHILIDTASLQTFRRIEQRLRILGECEQLAIRSHSDKEDTYALPSIHLPGRVETPSVPLDCCFRVSYLEPTANVYEPASDVFETFAYWLRECERCHEACSSSMADHMPTRLLQFTGGRLSLVHTATWTTKPRYATLSHCWGKSQFLKLLKENMDTFMQSIPVEQLPQTFKDALKIIRELGLQYIWIDSLCIIQNDEEDWKVEAGQMSSVYGGSFINIAASSAKGANEGCFLRSESRTEGFRSRVTAHDHKSTVAQFESASSYRKTVDDSHLATRAWTFQEKVLSPRTIHIGDRDALWECASKVATESLRDGLLAWRVTLMEDFNNTKNPTAWWSKAVGFYSSADITFPRDKLPALSGIAKQIHASSGSQYLAGIWSNAFIEQQLCWYVQPRRTSRRDRCARVVASSQSAYRAPSWSWASVDGTVVVPASGNTLELYAHVVDGWTTLSHEQDPFSEVTDGAIRIACSALLSGRCIVQYIYSGYLSMDSTRENRSKIQYRGDSPGDFEDTDECPCFLLPLVAADMAKSEAARGIALRRTNRVKGEFQRVGSFWTCYDEDTATEHLNREIERQGRATASAECEQIIDNIEHPNESFVITVI